MMSPLFQLVFILVVGTFCQIVGWRIKVPSILLLLITGIVVGPFFELLTPDALLGPILMPVVELSVAVILFEGGLSLKKAELGTVGSIVFRLIVYSAIITWILLTLLSHTILQLNGPASALLGAILVVSGPTVVVPLLQLIRARSPVEQVLRWEGILIDPIGVILAVLVAEVCESGADISSPLRILTGIIISLAIGGSLGWIGAQVLKLTIGQHRVADQFIVPLTLAVLFSLVVLSNLIHEQSGLLTSTVMGIIVARNQQAWVLTIEDFIGHTQKMLIAVLFITLAARIDPRFFQHFDWRLGLFILLAVVFVRPISVLISTIGSSLKFNERLAISALAPRGIVSAALASSLSDSLSNSGIEGMDTLVPFTFTTIIGTVAIYGIVSPWIFKVCSVQQEASEGVLFFGGERIAIEIGKLLKAEGFRVLFIDSIHTNIARIKAANLESCFGNILSDDIQENLDLEGLGKLLAFTPNDEANSLAAIEFKHIFGRKNVFQLPSSLTEGSRAGGRVFANKDLSLERLEELWSQGYRPYIVQSGEESLNNSHYILAEIENRQLFIVSGDNLGRATKPEKLLVFGALLTKNIS